MPTAAAARKALAETGRLRLQASEDSLRSWFTAPEQTWLATLPGRWLLLVHLQRGAEGRADALATSQALAATLAQSLGAAEVRALGLGGAVAGRGAQAPEVELWRMEEGAR